MGNIKKKEKCLFIGSKKLGFSVLKSLTTVNKDINWLVIHPDDTNEERSFKWEFINYCNVNSIQIIVTETAKQANKIIEEENFHFAMVCGWYSILPGDIVNGEKKSFYGIHNSLLPKYRGGSPLVWAIINGERTVGSTLFRLNRGIDSGNIINQVTYKMSDDDTIREVLNYFDEYWSKNIGILFQKIIQGNIEEIFQDEDQATYCSQRISKDGQINWAWPAKRIHNFVRAQTKPYPCAYTILDDRKINIVKTRLASYNIYCTPGQVIKRNLNQLCVGCGDNTALVILEAELDGQSDDLLSIFNSINLRL